MNLIIQQFLNNHVVVDQQDWVDHLELAKFCYNHSKHLATRANPFQMVTSKSPIAPMILATHGQPLNGANEEVPMITQLDEKRWRL
jgi:hypothetical protein